MRHSHTIVTLIARPYDDVYFYLARPANFGQWAAIRAGTFRPLPNGDWQGDTPFGFRHFRFTPVNPHGVLDHAIFAPGDPEPFMPMRAVPNGQGTEVIFTFFQRDGMDQSQFASAIEWITTDFLALKSLLEARNAP